MESDQSSLVRVDVSFTFTLGNRLAGYQTSRIRTIKLSDLGVRPDNRVSDGPDIRQNKSFSRSDTDHQAIYTGQGLNPDLQKIEFIRYN